MTPHRPVAVRAFTLIEMMIVVIILAIVANLAVPMLGSTAHTQLRAAADLLASDLAFAQIESISNGSDPRAIFVDDDGGGYRITLASDTDSPITDPITRRAYTTRFGAGRAASLTGISLAAISFSSDSTLAFGSFGQLDQASDATLRLACSGYSVTLTVNATTGKVTIGEIAAE